MNIRKRTLEKAKKLALLKFHKNIPKKLIVYTKPSHTTAKASFNRCINYSHTCHM